MLNKSIAYRLNYFISAAIIIIFLAFITANFLFNQKILKENIENKAINVSTKINSIVKKDIVTSREVAANIAEEIIYYSLNNNEEQLLKRVMNKYQFLNGIHVKIDTTVAINYHYSYIHRHDKKLIFKKSIKPIFYCKRELELFKDIINDTLVGWTNPYRCPEKKSVVVSCYVPIFYNSNNNTKLVGHIITELSLKKLNAAINNINIEKNGYAFLISKNGEYITHPQKKLIFKQNIYSLPHKIINPKKINIDKIISNAKSGTAIVYPEFYNYKKSWAYFTPINNEKWYMIYVVPYNKLFSELYFVTFRMIIFAIIGIIIIFYIIKYITKKMITPLSVATSKLRSLNSPVIEQKLMNTHNETKMVATTFDYLNSWFEKYNLNRKKEEIKNIRRKNDLQQAFDIQQSLIKTKFPAFPERKDIDLYAIYKPARGVSGDLFDYFFIDNDNLVFTIGDVSGNGVPAAIIMSIAQTIIKKNSLGQKARKIVTQSNTELCINNPHQFFLTLCVGVFNVKKGILNFCNAAHNFPIILKSDNTINELKITHGLPLGLFSEKAYNDSYIKLEKGDTIFLYTDGLTEQSNEQNCQFGKKRLKEKLTGMSGLPPSKIIDDLYNNFLIFKGKIKQTDDVCLFSIKYMPK